MPGLGRSPGEGNGNPLQDSCLENPMNRGAWEAAVHETWILSLGRENPLEEEMATHSRILACRIPWTEELGRLQSIELQRVNMTRVTEHGHKAYRN